MKKFSYNFPITVSFSLDTHNKFEKAIQNINVRKYSSTQTDEQLKSRSQVQIYLNDLYSVVFHISSANRKFKGTIDSLAAGLVEVKLLAKDQDINENVNVVVESIKKKMKLTKQFEERSDKFQNYLIKLDKIPDSKQNDYRKAFGSSSLSPQQQQILIDILSRYQILNEKFKQLETLAQENANHLKSIDFIAKIFDKIMEQGIASTYNSQYLLIPHKFLQQKAFKFIPYLSKNFIQINRKTPISDFMGSLNNRISSEQISSFYDKLPKEHKDFILPIYNLCSSFIEIKKKSERSLFSFGSSKSQIQVQNSIELAKQKSINDLHDKIKFEQTQNQRLRERIQSLQLELKLEKQNSKNSQQPQNVNLKHFLMPQIIGVNNPLTNPLSKNINIFDPDKLSYYKDIELRYKKLKLETDKLSQRTLILEEYEQQNEDLKTNIQDLQQNHKKTVKLHQQKIAQLAKELQNLKDSIQQNKVLMSINDKVSRNTYSKLQILYNQSKNSNKVLYDIIDSQRRKSQNLNQNLELLKQQNLNIKNKCEILEKLGAVQRNQRVDKNLLESQITTNEKSNKQFEKLKQALNNKQNQLNALLKMNKQNLLQKDQKISKFQAQIIDLTNQISNNSNIQKYFKLTKELSSVKQQLGKLQRENSRLRSDLSQIQKLTLANSLHK